MSRSWPSSSRIIIFAPLSHQHTGRFRPAILVGRFSRSYSPTSYSRMFYVSLCWLIQERPYRPCVASPRSESDSVGPSRTRVA